MKYTTIINENIFEIEISGDGKLTINGEERDTDFLSLGGSLYSFISNNQSYEVAVEDESGKYEVLINGRLYEGQVLDEQALFMLNRKGGLNLDSGEVNSPMPGLIVEVLVAVGDEVEAGDTVVILESMKMQNELKAPRAGKVQSVSIENGQTVDKGEFLVNIEGDDEEE